SVEGRYTGQSYLANTGDAQFVLPATYIADAQVAWTAGRYGVTLFANNIGNCLKYSSGYTDGSSSYYYPLPPRNVSLVVKAAF
ncbi:MAG TPA: hypothetical protein VG818_05895, partial [Gemmatimonadaceae bacterium]|nr:hypothetical protein [Gemmatimonadaceae bacterium]